MRFRCSVSLRDGERAHLSHLAEVKKLSLGLCPRPLAILCVLLKCKGIHYSEGNSTSARSHADQEHLWVWWGASSTLIVNTQSLREELLAATEKEWLRGSLNHLDPALFITVLPDANGKKGEERWYLHKNICLLSPAFPLLFSFLAPTPFLYTAVTQTFALVKTI